MNDREFACLDCKRFIDAGRRWCYNHPEIPGIIQAGRPVDVTRLLETAEYWDLSPTDDGDTAVLNGLPPNMHAFLESSPYWNMSSDYLDRLLPQIRAFLIEHQDHKAVRDLASFTV